MGNHTYVTLCLGNEPVEVKAVAYETHDTLHVTVDGGLTITGTAEVLHTFAASLVCAVQEAIDARHMKQEQALVPKWSPPKPGVDYPCGEQVA